MANVEKDPANSVAKVSEISARSTKSFEDAMQTGITRAAKTLRKRAQRVGEGATHRGIERQDHRLPGEPDGHVHARRLKVASR
jgi:flavin-binding protein dodecin